MKQMSTPALKAVAAGGAVAVAGFGALFVFHLVMQRDPSLPTMFADLCETFGDALALPIMTGALVYALTRLPSTSREGVYAASAAAAGGATGALTQLVRLADGAHELTWAHPRPHHFTAAGIYHAVFLTVMCAVTAALWTLALRRLVRAHPEGEGTKPARRALCVGLAAGLSFVVLLMMDDWKFLSTTSGATVLAATAAATALTVCLFVVVMLRGHRRRRGLQAGLRHGRHDRSHPGSLRPCRETSLRPPRTDRSASGGSGPGPHTRLRRRPADLRTRPARAGLRAGDLDPPVRVRARRPEWVGTQQGD
ncbi:hypothetical protein [Streptomyces sp. C10-9-1]|uniref:hypothetical protein n=1 Tax=Streptomyces sp. C10-9-1 TaxID=1859285 RepID=UPI003D7260A8